MRCHGGNPCQNCARMNVTCHSSFETNMRVSVASPGGQKDLNSTKASSAVPPSHFNHSGPRVSTFFSTSQHQQPTQFIQHLPTSPAPSLNTAGGFTSFGLPTTTPSSSNVPPSATSSETLDPYLFSDINLGIFGLNGAWDFDFSLQPYPAISFGALQDDFPLDPSLAQLSFGSDLFSTSNDRASGPIFHNVPVSALKPTEEWTPRRKKRKNKHQSATISITSTTAGGPDACCVSKALVSSHTITKVDLSARDAAHVAEKAPSDCFQDTEDDRFLHHYHSSIRNTFTTKQDSNWSYHRFIYDFVLRAQTSCPFRLSVLAWSAKHASLSTSQDVDSADVSSRNYYQQAEDEVSRLIERSDWTAAANDRHDTPVTSVIETIVCASLFMCRTDVLNGDLASVAAHLGILRNELVDRSLCPFRLSAFASKVLLWLCYLHVRVSIFSCAVSSQGTLLDVLVRRSDYASILSNSHNYLSEIFGDAYPTHEAESDAEKAPVSTRLHEVFCLMSSIVDFRAWEQYVESPSTTSSELRRAKIDRIEASIGRLDAQFMLAMQVDAGAAVLKTIESRLGLSLPLPSSLDNGQNTNDAPADFLTRTELHWLSSYAAFLSSRILWSRQQWPARRADPTSQADVRSILDIAIKLRRSSRSGSTAPGRILRSMLWPLPLFVAGIETTDEVYADWIRAFIEDMSASGDRGGGSGGAASTKVIEILARVREAQNRCESRVDVSNVIARMDAKKTFIF